MKRVSGRNGLVCNVLMSIQSRRFSDNLIQSTLSEGSELNQSAFSHSERRGSMAIFDFEVLVIAIYLFAVICWVIQKVLPKNPDLKNQRRY